MKINKYYIFQHHDGVEEEDVSGSVPQSWAKFSKNNVEESQCELFWILKNIFSTFFHWIKDTDSL